jgi:hypothetical protein
MKFKVGDIVCLPDDKYSAACYGFVVRIDTKDDFIVVQWFDGAVTDEDIPTLLIKINKED